MKASTSWLKELVPQLTASAKDLAARLTGAGLEVEGVIEYGAATDACIVSKVVSVRPHPSKSGLRLVTVDRGGAQQEVVCGAPNVPEPGWLVVLAPLGTHLPAKNLTIGKRAIGGVESEGMLCSENELGLGDDHDGIIVMPPGSAEVGATLSKAFPSMRDTVFEIGLTPNRPDGLGHVGLAREIAALYGFPFTPPDTKKMLAGLAQAGTATRDLVRIVVEDAERCPHYGAAAVVDVTIGPSPAWVKHRLQALGVRAISNLVDVTNLVMLAWGHPMHAFDLDRVRGGAIVVRRAKEGEKLTTLDGVERSLVADDLLICDGEGPVALAGVMGGASSEIQPDTKRVLFEVAWFDPRGVRRTARRHGMHTESSHRFERGVDPGDVVQVLEHAVGLTATLSPGCKQAEGRLHVQGSQVSPEPTAPERRAVKLRGHRIRDLLGVELPFAECVATLERLGCEVRGNNGSAADVVIPTHRPDLGREADLVEEVIRVKGIDSVPAELPAIRASRDVGGREELARRTRDIATSLGLSEAITYGFTSTKTLEALSAPKPTVVLENPLGEHQKVMRTTLLPGLLEAVSNARRHGEPDVREFTTGPVFLPSKEAGGLPDEQLRVAFVLAGDRPSWLEKPKVVDVWDAKGYALALATQLAGEEASAVQASRADAPAHLHPRGAAFVEVGGKRIGSFGPLHPDAVDALGLEGEVMVGELDLEPFTRGAKLPKYVAIPRFPASTRDIALEVKDGIPAGEVESAVRAAAGPLAADVQLFDRYVGGQIKQGFSSLAFHVVYRAPDRTLTDAEVDLAHENVKKTVFERFGATQR
ncbi:MAG: phenylalanine--tRNA ligase subunit beta [Deltaproteobacteria bacterium]|nr:phenylalanine--tRNA ligase subunit beta [Deltaproteobacteria bacterium]